MPHAPTDPRPAAPPAPPVAQLLRPYQAACVRDALAWVASATPPARRLYSATTGSGKGSAMLALRHALCSGGLDTLILSPSLDVLRGLLDRPAPGCPAAPSAPGAPPSLPGAPVPSASLSDDALAEAALTLRYATTPTRLRNAILSGARSTLPDVILIDECFPAGTLVGGRPIEQVRVGDLVPSFDSERPHLPLLRPVVRVFRSAPHQLVTIHHKSGAFVCTPGHPVLTPLGWRAAATLTSHDMVLTISPVEAQHGSVRVGGALRGVWRAADPDWRASLPGSRARLGALPGASGGGQVGVRQGGREPDGVADESAARLRTHEAQEPHAPGGRAGARGCAGAGAGVACGNRAGREREAPSGSTGAAGLRARLAYRSGGQDTGAWHGSAGRVQDRRGVRGAEDSGRSGRRQPRHAEAPSPGPREGSFPAWSRVDRVAIHQPGGDGTFGGLCPDGLVYNLEVAGTHTYVADGVAVHNCHHAVDRNEVAGTLAAVSGDDLLWIGFTATPYRGTPQATRELREQWGQPVSMLDLDQAVGGGWVSLPRVRVVPLVDDDTVKVVGGEFAVTGADSAGSLVTSRADAIAAHVASLPRRPTVVAVPSTEAAGAVVEALDRLGVDAASILQHTPLRERAAILDQCRRSETVVVQIRCVSEGVDLPWLRRIVDARPVVSPVAWVQLLGRCMRPHGDDPSGPPEYHALCRNLERHAYLLGGALPREAVREAQAAFGTPSKRAGSRGIGFEALGRFKAIPLPLLDGATGHMYTLSAPSEVGAHELVCLVSPHTPEPVVAVRTVHFARGEDPPGSESTVPRRSWGPWQRIPLEACADLTGYQTSQSHLPFTPKQRARWESVAHRVGLDPAAAPTLKRRQYAALPVLLAIGAKL